MKRKVLGFGIVLLLALTACGEGKGEIAESPQVTIAESNVTESKSQEESFSEQQGTKSEENLTEWSAWTDALPSDITSAEYEIETRKLYSVRRKTAAVDNNISKSWGDWSEWQDEAVVATETRQVEVRTVDDLSNPVYKTQYQYDRWKASEKNSNGKWVFGPTQGTWGGMKCDNHETSDWMDAPLAVTGHQSSAQAGEFDFYEGPWFNETTRQVETGTYNQKTQYRYSEQIVQNNGTSEVWSDWSDFTEEETKADENTEVRERTMYRYRKK